MKRLLYLAAFSAACAAAVSCSDTCAENKNALPRAAFYAYADSAMRQVTIDSLEVVGVGIEGDSALSAASEPKSELYLPFRIDSDTTRYVFIDARTGSSLRDTLTFAYTRTPRFVNVECGVSYLYEIESIEWQGALIDSVVCPNGYIDNTNAVNLNIYFAAAKEE